MMTSIYCTSKLKEFLGPKNFGPTTDSSNSHGEWNAHLFYFSRKKNIILVNNKSYYAVILENIKKANINDFNTIFISRLIEQLLYDKIIEIGNVNAILSLYVPLRFQRTNNDKKTLGTINEFILHYRCNLDTLYWQNQSLLELNSKINDSLTGAARTKKWDYGNPIRDMKALLNSSENKNYLSNFRE